MTYLKSSKALLIMLVLSGCQSTGFQSVTVPTFTNEVPLSKHHQRLDGAVEIRYLESAEFDQALASGVGALDAGKVKESYAKRGIPRGFATRSPEGDCVVYMERKPFNVNDSAWFYVFGHEVFHCLMPDFH